MSRNRRLPRVLYAIALDPGVKFGTIEEQLVFLAQAFQREGGLCLPLFITKLDEQSLGDYRERGVRAECLDLTRFRPRQLLKLRSLIDRECIDIVHWHFVDPIKNAYLWALSVLHPSVSHWFTDHISRVTSVAKSNTGIKQTCRNVLLRRYRVVVCVSRYVQQWLQQQGGWSTLVVSRHFVNTARFAPSVEARLRIRRQLEARDAFVLLFVGQLIPEKGVGVAVEMMARLPSHTKLWLVGSGPYEQDLATRIRELNLNDRVRILGPQVDVAPYCQAADALLCPSVWYEAAGLVNLEAQACGLPVVASRIGGIPEYVEDGRTGLLFESGNVDALARQVGRLIDSCQLRTNLATQARNHALQRFSPEARLPELVELYREESQPRRWP